MAKAVLVMDMPENCFKCKLQSWANCKITNKCHVGECRPDLCPLWELPEKILESKSGYEKVTTSVKRIGWNECLDAILEKIKNRQKQNNEGKNRQNIFSVYFFVKKTVFNKKLS